MSSKDSLFQFHRLTDRGRPPRRADRSAMGTLPLRAVRYCEAVTSATSFGWWVFAPIELELQWSDSEIFWCCHEAPDWMPLQPAAQLPDYVEEFDQVAPASLKGCSPPFLTALPEPGVVQLWTGLIAETAPGWHLLVRSPVNLAPIGGLGVFEGIIETDRWFGPLFINMRLTRSHTPIRIRSDYPLAQVQPIPRHAYSTDTLDRMSFTTSASELTTTHWDAYHATIVEPNTRPNRPFGCYATETRKRRRQCTREQEAD